MFEQLTELKNKMDKGKFPSINLSDGEDISQLVNIFAGRRNDISDLFMNLEDVYAYIVDKETRDVVIEFVRTGREYYNNPTLTLEAVLSLYNQEMNIKGANAILNTNIVDYYSQDEAISWVAASVFDDEHFGGPIIEAEQAYREGLKVEYKDEINMAKVIIGCNADFEDMTYKNKINYVANLIVELRKQKLAKEEVTRS